ncbi:MAG: type I DNA topoisomerase [Planctomycetaceae bacterium]
MAAAKKKGLVIVESPAKAKKIGSFLGSDYDVRASVGHVRDLPGDASQIPAEVKAESWSRLGVNVDEDFAPLYVVSPDKKKLIKELKSALKDAAELFIATDEDREGESIGWHLTQLLEPKVPIRRMVFSEITKKAILEALRQTRELDINLVQAQETRRVLDRLYGYTLSPLLWKKIKRGLSAGRVQSVAVRVLVQRELERLAFRSGRYWDLKADLTTSSGGTFSAMLTSVDGKRVASGKDFDEHTGKIQEGVDVLLLDEKTARTLQQQLQTETWAVTNLEERQQTRRPAPPFTTSTLQQEANRKLNLTARQAMQLAQRLYENGHITYMRTDSVSLSQEALQAARGRIQSDYGQPFLSPQPRQYSTKTKNAQEAHEAIRPAGSEMKTAQEIGLSGAEGRLYDMIWKRTMASQMAEAQLRFDTVTIQAGNTEFRATGRHVEFPGFFRVYVEGQDDAEAPHDDEEAALPKMTQGDRLGCSQVDSLSHETKPPARYTEASIVRKLEQEGVGRPSTYASIISTVQDRGYVRKQGNQLVPTFTALAVTKLLEDYFPNLVDLQFTAQMEQSLDDISNGDAERLPYLKQFYSGNDGLDQQVKLKEEQIDPRLACTLQLDGLEAAVRVGRYGPYLEKVVGDEVMTASLPDELSPADISPEMAEKLFRLKQQGPQSLGTHPEEGLEIFVLSGPFGPYLQLGEVTDDGPKPKRVSVPKNVDPLNINLEIALKLLALPKRLGHHPDDQKVVNAGVGRFGPYVQHAGRYKSLGKDDDILTITLDRAVELLKEAKVRGGATPIRELGPHPADQQPVNVFEGKYGAYVKHGQVNATIPKEFEVSSITLEEAIVWLAEKAAKGGKKGAKKGTKKAAKKAPAKKTAAKKTTTKKKAAPKKSTRKKDVEE